MDGCEVNYSNIQYMMSCWLDLCKDDEDRCKRLEVVNSTIVGINELDNFRVSVLEELVKSKSEPRFIHALSTLYVKHREYRKAVSNLIEFGHLVPHQYKIRKFQKGTSIPERSMTVDSQQIGNKVKIVNSDLIGASSMHGSLNRQSASAPSQSVLKRDASVNISKTTVQEEPNYGKETQDEEVSQKKLQKPHCTFGIRYNQQSNSETIPGPGTYNVEAHSGLGKQILSHSKSAPIVSIKGREALRPPKAVCDNIYKLPSTIGHSIESHILNAPSFQMGQRIVNKATSFETDTPGPGKYIHSRSTFVRAQKNGLAPKFGSESRFKVPTPEFFFEAPNPPLVVDSCGKQVDSTRVTLPKYTLQGRVVPKENTDVSKAKEGTYTAMITVKSSFGKQTSAKYLSSRESTFGVHESTQYFIPPAVKPTPAPWDYEVNTGMFDKYKNHSYKVKVRGCRLSASRRKKWD
jgi:hypothetical protein